MDEGVRWTELKTRGGRTNRYHDAELLTYATSLFHLIYVTGIARRFGCFWNVECVTSFKKLG